MAQTLAGRRTFAVSLALGCLTALSVGGSDAYAGAGRGEGRITSTTDIMGVEAGLLCNYSTPCEHFVSDSTHKQIHVGMGTLVSDWDGAFTSIYYDLGIVSSHYLRDDGAWVNYFFSKDRRLGSIPKLVDFFGSPDIDSATPYRLEIKEDDNCEQSNGASVIEFGPPCLQFEIGLLKGGFLLDSGSYETHAAHTGATTIDDSSGDHRLDGRAQFSKVLQSGTWSTFGGTPAGVSTNFSWSSGKFCGHTSHVSCSF